MLTAKCANIALATRTAWFLLGRIHPSLARIFLGVVVPLSLLPPLMLYIAGTYHGDNFMPGFATRNWLEIGAIFLVAELATVGAMGPIIRWIARLNGVAANKESSYLLAFAAPIPLWLSSLSLLVPNFFFAAAVALAAFGLACVIIYHGVAALLRVQEDIVAGSVAYGIMASGLVAWALLLVIVIPM